MAEAWQLEICPMSQRSRLQDVANTAGVSFITAWRALNKPEMLRAETLAKVRSAADEVGYVGNAVARSLATARSGVVGVIIPTLDDSIFAATVEGLSDGLRKAQREMLIGISRYSQDRETELVRAFLGQQIDALILTGADHSDATRRLLDKSDITVVEIWDVPDDPIDLFVGFSNSALAEAATGYLIKRGYRRIAFVSPEHRTRARRREAAYQMTMRKAGLDKFCQSYWVEPTLQGGAEALDALLEQTSPPEAIFFNGDTLAVGAHLHGTAIGLEFPRDVALLGLHDTDLASRMQPPLTSIKIPRYEIGRLAAEEIISSRDSGGPGKSRVIGFSISERETT